MIKLARFLKPYKKQVTLGPIFKLVEAIFELIVPLVMAKIIDVGIPSSNYNYVLRLGALLVLLGIIGLFSAVVCQYFAAQASQGFGTTLRNQLFFHINSLSHAEIDRLGAPSMVTRMTNDINQLQLAVAMLIRLVIRAPFLVAGSIIMAISIDVNMSVIFLLSAVIISIVLYIIIKTTVPIFKLVQAKLDKISLISRENLQGNRVIRAFSKQREEISRFNDANSDLLGSLIKVGKISALLNPATYVVINLSIAAIVWLGGIRVNIGTLSTGEIIALVNYMTQILLALVVVANLVVIFSKASASAARVNELLNISSSISDNSPCRELSNNHENKIEFQSVCFCYAHSGKNALENISFSIKPGQTIGIIGATGSGKTTLINLMPRFYDATFGNIFVDGKNVKSYTLDELRSKFGIVPQRAVLFSGTVRENLLWGNPNASDADIYSALETAQAAEFINKLPEGINSPVSRGGKNFSGGQLQRLTIARALVRKPEILILDDSSSALDFATDAALRSAIKKTTDGTTVILISQRTSSLMHADNIIVFEDGKIAGIGNHDNLLKNCDIYREIHLSQTCAKGADNNG